MQNDFNNWQNDVAKKVEINPTPASVSTPMKWHKFLIYFLLWLGGIANILSGLVQLSGSQYGVDAAQVYAYYNGLQSIDLVFGVMCIGLGAAQIVARFKLARFKAVGPKLLLATYLGAAAFNLLYPVVASAVTGLALSELLDVGTVIGNVLMFFLNRIYYSKRAQMFVF